MTPASSAPTQELLEKARHFAATVVAPAAGQLDAEVEPENCFSWDIVEQGDRLGLRTATLSPKYGGIGMNWPGFVRVVHELAQGDVGISVVFGQALKLGKILETAGSDWQRERFLEPFSKSPRFLPAIGITEPETASDYIIPYREDKRFATVAKREGDDWVISGKKHFISNGDNAQLYFVLAQTDPTVSIVEGSTCFLVERDTPGFSTGRVHDKMGKRLVTNAELLFDDCRVPAEHIMGEVGGGFPFLGRFFPASNASAAGAALGIAEAAYQRALSWTRERVQGGRPLIEHASTREDLAAMRMKIDGALAYIDLAAQHAELPPEQRDRTLTALPKVLASQVAWEVVTKALELHGGYGYMREVGFEKLVRDAAAYLHTDGANRALLLKAANVML